MTRSKDRVYDLDSGKWKRSSDNIFNQSDNHKPLLIILTNIVVALLVFVSCNCCTVKFETADSTTPKPEPLPFEVKESTWLAYNTACALCGEPVHKQRTWASDTGEKATYVKDKYGLIYCPACGRKLILDFEKEQEDRRKLEEVLNNGNVE